MKHFYSSLIALLIGTAAMAQGTWNLLTPFPDTARVYAVAFSIGDLAYYGTGTTDSSVLMNDFWSYDPATDSWTQLADFAGSPRHSAVGFSVNGKGYIGTGNDGTTQLADFWEYDPAADSWTQIADFPGPVRNNATAFTIGDTGYVVTGWGGTWHPDMWGYDAAAGAWSQKANFAGPGRIRSTAFSAGGKGYVVTGHTSGSHAGYNDLWEYDGTSDTWTQKADIPVVRHSAAAFGMGNFGYVVAGFEGGAYVNTTYEYNTITDTWAAVSTTTHATIIRASGCSVGEVGYLIGGQNDSMYTTNLMAYEPVWMGVSNQWVNQLNVYPNPASSTVWIELEDEGSATLQLLDACGRLIRSWRTTNQLEEVDLQGMQRGWYLIRVHPSGGQPQVVKLVVHH